MIEVKYLNKFSTIFWELKQFEYQRSEFSSCGSPIRITWSQCLKCVSGNFQRCFILIFSILSEMAESPPQFFLCCRKKKKKSTFPCITSHASRTKHKSHKTVIQRSLPYTSDYLNSVQNVDFLKFHLCNFQKIKK